MCMVAMAETRSSREPGATRVLAHGTLFGTLVNYIDRTLTLPAYRVPAMRVESVEEIERAAEECRKHLELGRDLPVKNLTRAVERAGVVVTRFEGCSTKIDAFSRAGSRSVIILNTEKDAPARSRFDLAHELGHLVMHGGRTTGDPDTEKEADRFASALLLPRAGYAPEFPRGQRLDWGALFQRERPGASSVRPSTDRCRSVPTRLQVHRREGLVERRAGRARHRRAGDPPARVRRDAEGLSDFAARRLRPPAMASAGLRACGKALLCRLSPPTITEARWSSSSSSESRSRGESCTTSILPPLPSRSPLAVAGPALAAGSDTYRGPTRLCKKATSRPPRRSRDGA